MAGVKAASWQDIGDWVPSSTRYSPAQAPCFSPSWANAAFLRGLPTFSQGYAHASADSLSLPNDPEFGHLLSLSVLSQDFGTVSMSSAAACHPSAVGCTVDTSTGLAQLKIFLADI